MEHTEMSRNERSDRGRYGTGEKGTLTASQGSVDRIRPQPLAAQIWPCMARKRKSRCSFFPPFQDSRGSCLLQSPLNCPTAQWLFSAFCKLHYRTVSLHKADGKGPCNQVTQISLALLKPSEQYRFLLPDAQALMPVVSPGVEPSSQPPHCDSCSILPWVSFTQLTMSCGSTHTFDTTRGTT